MGIHRPNSIKDGTGKRSVLGECSPRKSVTGPQAMRLGNPQCCHRQGSTPFCDTAAKGKLAKNRQFAALNYVTERENRRNALARNRVRIFVLGVYRSNLMCDYSLEHVASRP